jgi:adenylate cyclase
MSPAIAADGRGRALKAVRRELGDPKIAELRGRLVKTTGDGLLVEFPSVMMHLAGEHGLAAAAVERALVLNPNCAHAWMVSGYIRCFSNRLEEAIDSIYRALRLSPLDPLAYLFRQCMALAHLVAGRYHEAMAWIDQSLAEQPRFLPALRVKVAVCGYLGRADEGNRWLRRALEINPDLTVAGFDSFASTFMSPEVRVRYVGGMRRAGLPEA